MHRFLLFNVFILLAAAKSYSQRTPVNCGDMDTQMEINLCAAKEFAKADQNLNTIYKKVISKLSSEEKSFLIAAQKSWIVVRDNHCSIYTKLYEGGSMMPLMVNTCKTELTQNRIKELRALLKELEN